MQVLSISPGGLPKRQIFGTGQQNVPPVSNRFRRPKLVLSSGAQWTFGIYAILAAFVLCSGTAGRQAAPLVGGWFCGAVWFGIQHLSLSRCGQITGRFLQGSLRRVIDQHSRLEELERSLARTSGLEECWAMIEGSCREFGFSGGRLSAQGRVFESASASAGRNELWQLRIPISKAQYVNLYRDPEAEDDPAVIARLAGILQTGLKERLGASEARAPREESSRPESVRSLTAKAS